MINTDILMSVLSELSRARTYDIFLKREALYQLSYEPTKYRMYINNYLKKSNIRNSTCAKIIVGIKGLIFLFP